MVRAGHGVWRLGRVWSSAELCSRGALVNGGGSLGHLFLVSRGDREGEGRLVSSERGSNALLHIYIYIYILIPYSSLHTCPHMDLLLAHRLFFFFLQTTLEYKLLHAKQGHWVQSRTFYSVPPLASSNQSASCWQTISFLRALTKTGKMSQCARYSHRDRCCSSNIAWGCSTVTLLTFFLQTGPAASRHNAHLSKYNPGLS